MPSHDLTMAVTQNQHSDQLAQRRVRGPYQSYHVPRSGAPTNRFCLCKAPLGAPMGHALVLDSISQDRAWSTGMTHTLDRLPREP